MPRIRTPDEDRIQKLRDWLESRGVDVLRVGNDLTMPSPFKEREKRKVEGPGYVDQKHRLSVTVELSDGKPIILWQCWYTKRPDGKPFGGATAYALSARTGVDQDEIYHALDMEYDEEVVHAQELEDKVAAILTQRKRLGRQRAERRHAGQDVVLQPYPVPPGLIPVHASSVTRRGETWLAERGIGADRALRYSVCWDLDTCRLAFPWYDHQGTYVYHIWYDHEERCYRFPKTLEGHLSKRNLIYGIHLWNPSIPLILSEGVFEALTIYGQALGGSSLTDDQLAIIASLKPQKVILALDIDGAGVAGAQGMRQRIRSLLGIPTDFVFPPGDYKDWNDMAQRVGADETFRAFGERACRPSQMRDYLEDQVRQILRR